MSEMCSSDVPAKSALSLVTQRARGQRIKLTRGRIDNQVIQVAPAYFRQELPDHPILLGPSPHYTIPSILEQEPDTHHPESPLLIDIYGNPASR